MTRRALAIDALGNVGESFTPGPWEVEQDTTLVWARDGGSVNGTPIARCETQYRHWGRSVSLDEHDANARLIASAPELYDGCNALLGLIQLIRGRSDLPTDLQMAIDDDNHRIAEALAAVAKARGDAQ